MTSNKPERTLDMQTQKDVMKTVIGLAERRLQSVKKELDVLNAIYEGLDDQ